MSEFERRVVEAVKKSQHTLVSTWEVARVAFSEKWKKSSGRGALVGHIDRVFYSHPELIRHAPEDEHSTAKASVPWGSKKKEGVEDENSVHVYSFREG